MLESIDKSLRAIVAVIDGVGKALKGFWNFLMDPITCIQGIADPIFLVVIAVLILLKAFGIDTGKYMKVTTLVYIIILFL